MTPSLEKTDELSSASSEVELPPNETFFLSVMMKMRQTVRLLETCYLKRLNHEKKIKSKTLSGKISSSWLLPCSQASILKCLYFKKVACQRSNLSASVFFSGRCLILYPGQARFLSLLKPLMPNSTRLVLHVVTVYNTTLEC